MPVNIIIDEVREDIVDLYICMKEWDSKVAVELSKILEKYDKQHHPEWIKTGWKS